jgi:DNA-binding NarL/FixJ family response regulator
LRSAIVASVKMRSARGGAVEQRFFMNFQGTSAGTHLARVARMRSTTEQSFQTANRVQIPTMKEIGQPGNQFPPYRAAYGRRYISFSETPLRELTPREIEVLQLIACGSLNKQIASELSISIKTVERHRQNLTSKLGIHGTACLTHYAIYFGIVPCDPQLTAT